MNADTAMGFLKGRRSIRSYTAEPVPREDIERMVEAASWAPSGSNTQNWRFVAVTTRETICAMAEEVRGTVDSLAAKIPSPRAVNELTAYSRYYAFFDKAPLVFGIVGKPYGSIAARIYERYDLIKGYSSGAELQGPSAAIQNLLLMAHALGYGSCWMTGPMIAREALERILDVNAPDRLVAIVPVGKPAATPKAPARNPVSEILAYK